MASNFPTFTEEETQEEERDIHVPSFTEEELSTTRTIIYLYHVHNISPKHAPHFFDKYKEHIVAWAKHNKTDSTDEFDGTEQSEGIKNKIECPKGTHLHVVLCLTISLGKAKGGNAGKSYNSKWFGFNAVEVFKTDDGRKFKTELFQDKYKYTLVMHPNWYINLLEYMKTRTTNRNDFTVKDLEKLTPNKCIYSGKDPTRPKEVKETKAGTINVEEDYLKIIDDLTKADIEKTKQIELNYKVYKVLFVDKSYSTIEEYERSTGMFADDRTKEAYTKGREAVRYLRRSKCTQEDYDRISKFPLTVRTIKLIILDIVIKSLEKNVFLTLQGPTSCGKSTLATAIASAWPSVFDCPNMRTYLGVDTLGSSKIATEFCQSIICEEFPYIDHDSNSNKHSEAKTKNLLCGREVFQRIPKNIKPGQNEYAWIKLIVATSNNEEVWLRDAVRKFHSSKSIQSRSILTTFLTPYVELFNKEKTSIKDIPTDSFCKFAYKFRSEIEPIIDKIHKQGFIEQYLNDLNTHLNIIDKVDKIMTIKYTSNFASKFYRELTRINSNINIPDIIEEDITSNTTTDMSDEESSIQ